MSLSHDDHNHHNYADQAQVQIWPWLCILNLVSNSISGIKLNPPIGGKANQIVGLNWPLEYHSMAKNQLVFLPLILLVLPEFACVNDVLVQKQQ